MTEQPDRNRIQASEYLRQHWQLSYTPNTLARMASNGRGPDYHHRGRFAFYAQSDLDAWAQTKITLKRKNRRTFQGGAA